MKLFDTCLLQMPGKWSAPYEKRLSAREGIPARAINSEDVLLSNE